MRNPQRRAVLVDAAIDVLAAEGARGLTFRAVDLAAGVPVGTASNYFANRDALLNQVGRRIHARLAPEPGEVEAVLGDGPRTRSMLARLLRELMARTLADRAGYLALLELRLEATRRPELRVALTKALRENLELNMEFHRDEALPGRPEAFLSMYFAMSGLLVEHLTTPDVLAGYDVDALVEILIDGAAPE